MKDRKKSIYNRIVKRLFDVLISFVSIVILAIPMAIVALAIKIDSPGPVLFKQERIGKNGKIFTIYKFRSMCIGAEKTGSGVYSNKNDARVTRVGKFIRKTSIDELPQLFNILKGDMSIVGPRPALPREVEQYSVYQTQRLFITPGLTCYWQIQPNRNDISFDEWVEMDIRYIRERSFLVDWKIIFKTIIVVLTKQGR